MVRRMRTYKLKKITSKKEFKINYNEELNKQQLKVVFNGGGASLVLAGPGSGKTRVLVYRVAYLLEKKADPANILLLTFTNKAAKNMLSRVERLLGYYPKSLVGGTFHHVGNLILRKNAKKIGFDSNFSIIDNEDSRQIIRDIIANIMPKKNKHFPKSNVIFSIISFAKNAGLTMKSCIKNRFSYYSKFLKEMTRVAELYEQRKVKANLLDFDDLLFYWDKLLNDEAVRDFYVKKFKYILVDEFQDTNKLQFSVIKKLTDGFRNNVMVVGDDCQSIYSFRAAEIKNILDFPKHYKKAKEFKLEINYRSVPAILNLINQSIKNNKNQFKKNLKPVNKGDTKPVLVHCQDSQQEAEFVCQRILDLNEKGVPYDEIGVLFRAGYQSATMELELTKRGIPFKKRGGLRFFEQKHIKDMTSFLKLFNNSKDELSYKRILCLFEGIGPASAIKIWDELSKSTNPIESVKSKTSPKLTNRPLKGWMQFKKIILKAPKNLLPSEIANHFLKSFYKDYLKENYPNFKDRLLDLNQYINLANQYKSINNFIEDIMLDADLTNREDLALVGSEVTSKQEDEAVILSTIHQAKGLEWQNVFIISLAEERFPLAIAYAEDSLEEERRLFYVACSRAKKGLYLCIPMEDYTFWGGYQILKDSLFVQELPESCYEEWNLEEDD
ncbi:MAG: ATP-dependent helicase [Candidatus Woesearchaeota archaeon]